MEKLKHMKEAIMSCVESQVYGNMDTVDTKELGEAIDMLKDLSEAIYYCTITEAMEEGEKDGKGQHRAMYYNDRITPMYRNSMTYPVEHIDPRYRERYMTDYTSDMNGGSMSRNYRDGMVIYPHDRDPREGRSGMSRKMYMEGKYTHKDKSKSMMELDAYVQELTSDLMDMVHDASPEEKTMLQQKISTLASKIK